MKVSTEAAMMIVVVQLKYIVVIVLPRDPNERPVMMGLVIAGLVMVVLRFVLQIPTVEMGILKTLMVVARVVPQIVAMKSVILEEVILKEDVTMIVPGQGVHLR